MSAQQGSIPALSKNDIAKFTQLYQRSKTPNQNFISGEQARGIFLKANVSTDILGTIWALADVNAAGVLTEPQFIMAMHLIQLFVNRSITAAQLPPVLPQYLWDSLSGTATPSAVSSPSLSKTPLSSTATGDWTLDQLKKQEFDKIFESLDTEKKGHLPSSKLVPFFLSSKLSQDVLASVWDLADINNSSEFSKKEFAIAMFLIQKKNSGVELPDALPQSLLDSVSSQSVAAPAIPQIAATTRNVTPSAVPSIPTASVPAVANVASTATTTATNTATTAATAVAAAVPAVASSAPVDKEKRINNELKRINATKKTIEDKLKNLHVTHDKNVKETEHLELNLIQRQNELKALQKHLDQLEMANTTELKNINQMNENLKIAVNKKNELTNNITQLKISSESLSKELGENQVKFKQQSSLLDVNKKQLDTIDSKNNNLQNELSLLSASLPIFVSKFKSYLENQNIVEQQHAKLQDKYKELDKRNNDLKDYETKIEEQTKDIESNEQNCDEKVDRLQQLFDEFTLKQKDYESENEKLKSKHVEYAQELQDLTERQMKLNLGEIPETIDDILIKLNMYNNKSSNGDETKDIIKDESPKLSGLESTEGEAREGSDLFDKDIPVAGSQTEGEQDEEERHENAAEALDNRFEGDLNEYGIPRTQSLTSSVSNNPALSVREDTVELSDKQTIPTADLNDLKTKTSSNILVESESTTKAAENKEELDISDNIEELQGKSTEPVKNFANIDEEFPPIQEPYIEESDSSDDDIYETSKRSDAASLNDKFDKLEVASTASAEVGTETFVDTVETTPTEQ